MRTLTNAQVKGALAPCNESVPSAADAVQQMARKAYCKAAGIPDQDTNRSYTIGETYDCLRAVWAIGQWPAVVRMATHLIEEAARSGEMTTT